MKIKITLTIVLILACIIAHFWFMPQISAITVDQLQNTTSSTANIRFATSVMNYSIYGIIIGLVMIWLQPIMKLFRKQYTSINIDINS